MARSSTAKSGIPGRIYRSNWFRWPLYGLLGLLVIEAILQAGDPSSVPGSSMPASTTLLWVPQDGDPREASFTLDQSVGTTGRTAVFVGDSSVYGHGVYSAESFPALVAKQAAGRIRTLNLAAPGYSTYQSIRVLEAVLPRERPELVVVANLWSDSNIDSFVDRELLERQDSLAFRIFFHANRVLSNLATWRVLLKGFGNLQARTVGWGQGLEPNARDQRRVAINDYAANLQRISELAQENGAEVLFLMLANEEDFREAEAIWPWHLYREVMVESASRLGHPIILLPQELVATGLSAKALFMDEMHPSSRGHEVIAELIVRHLEEWGWLDGGDLPGEPNGLPRSTYLDPLVSVASGPMKSHRRYSVTGILKTPVEEQKKGYSSTDSRRAKLEAVSQSEPAEVLDSVTIPLTAAFVLTVDPPQPVALVLRQGVKQGGEMQWGEPVWLQGGLLDLTVRPYWSILIDVPQSAVVHPALLPDGWIQFQ
jgi:lysophospholipase L1-like esterase